MPVSLDLRRAHLVRLHGDVTAVYTWVNDTRALVLVASYRGGSATRPGAPWYVILESNAHAYDDPIQLARTAHKAASVLGLDDSSATWAKIATIIHEGLPDLVRMPAAPPAEFERGSFGHMTLKADGQAIAGQDIRIEKDGAEYA